MKKHILRLRILHALRPFTKRGVKCANPAGQNNAGKPYCLVFDWAQASVSFRYEKIVPTSNGGTRYALIEHSPADFQGFLFRLNKTDRKSLHYRYNWDIETMYFGEWEKFASIEFQPFLKAIPQDNAQIRLENKFLYTAKGFECFELLIGELGCRFKHWSRLDFAIDFQKFQLNNISPKNFIRYVAKGQIAIRGVRKSRSRANNFISPSMHLPKVGSETFMVSHKEYCGLYIGTYKSPVSIKMYNKTLELRQKTVKPYIYSMWDGAGFNYTDNDVWRIEFATKNSNKKFVDVESGEIIATYKDFHLFHPDTIHDFVKSLLAERFRTAYTRGQKQFCRMERIELFDIEGQTYALPAYTEVKNTSNMDRYRIKNMVKMYITYLDENKEVAKNLKYAILNEVADHAQTEWFEKMLNHNYKNTPLSHVCDRLRCDAEYDSIHSVTLAGIKDEIATAMLNPEYEYNGLFNDVSLYLN